MAAFQAVINGLGGLGKLISLLPASPFQNLGNLIGENPALDFVLWLFPVGQALSLFQAWLTAILIYYAVKVPLRWAKVMQG
jgi:hypothetical protein